MKLKKTISFAIFLMIISVSIFAISQWNEGYRVNKGDSVNVYVGPEKECHKVSNNNPSWDFFIPTKTTNEWDSFANHLPSGVSIGSCCSEYSPICPSGYTLSGNQCIKTESVTLSCPSGSNYNPSTNRCEKSASESVKNEIVCSIKYGFTHCLQFSDGKFRVIIKEDKGGKYYGNWANLVDGCSYYLFSNNIKVEVCAANKALYIKGRDGSNSNKVSLFGSGSTSWILTGAEPFMVNYPYVLCAAFVDGIETNNGEIRLGLGEGSSAGDYGIACGTATKNAFNSKKWGNWFSLYSLTCPSGWALSGSVCYQSPTCPSGYTLSGNHCVRNVYTSPTCPNGCTYDSSTSSCINN